LRDWRQTSTSPRWKRWRNRHKDEVVHIVLDKDNTWYFMVKDNQRAFILKENLTKERALKFAKAYMKKH
jgi:hypothetical protein